MHISGYPIVFNAESVNLGGFIEIIRPSAVDRTLRTGADVAALVGHDPNKVVGRTTARTLRLIKDARGLQIDVNADEAISYVSDIARVIRRGDALGGSFGFRVPAGGDLWSIDASGIPLREVIDMHIAEASIGVTFPAYPSTELSIGPTGPRAVAVGAPSVALAARALRLARAR